MRTNFDDKELITKAKLGNSEAFGQLIDRYKNAVYGSAYARLGNFTDAQDIAQETFLTAFRKLSTLKKPERFGNWLYSIVKNKCYDHHQSQKTKQELDKVRTEYFQDPEDEHNRRTLHRKIQQAIQKLPQIHREVVTLHYIQDYKLTEISSYLNIPIGTVKRRLSDARQKLKLEMIDMARDLFDAHKLPKAFQKVIVNNIDKTLKNERATLSIKSHNKRGFAVEIVGHQHAYIYHTLNQSSPVRPLTYDFMRDICAAFQIQLNSVQVSPKHANLTFSKGKKSVTLETTPGYAFALALAFDTPVYADLASLTKKQPTSFKPTVEKPFTGVKVKITPDIPWVIFDTTNDKPDHIAIDLSIHPQPQELAKLPTKRSRVRRLATKKFESVDLSKIQTQRHHTQSALIWLTTPKGNVVFPIEIGNYEASAIASHLPKQFVKLKNSTNVQEKGRLYDLQKEVLDAFGVTCENITIDFFRSNIFYALCCFRRGKKQIYLDTRPSDAIAIAVRNNATMTIEKNILRRCGLKKSEKGLEPLTKPKRSNQQKKQPKHHLSVGTKIQYQIPSRRKFIWSSSDPKVAKVSQEGVVKALKPGTVNIIAKWQGLRQHR